MKLVVLGATGNTGSEEFLLTSREGAILRMKLIGGQPLPIVLRTSFSKLY